MTTPTLLKVREAIETARDNADDTNESAYYREALVALDEFIANVPEGLDAAIKYTEGSNPKVNSLNKLNEWNDKRLLVYKAARQLHNAVTNKGN